MRFNHGSLAAGTGEGEVGVESQKILNRVDKRRVSAAVRKVDDKEETRKRKISIVLEEESKKAGEGVTYSPGVIGEKCQ